MTRFLLFFGCLFAFSGPIRAQTGFTIVRGGKEVEIPFEYVNNFIILTVNFNGYLPLKFIFDTGAEHTILTKREISDLLHVPYEHEFRVTGSDLKTPLVAYLARRIRFEIPEKVSAPSEDILVLQDDYFSFEEYAGVDVHGILSAVMFSKYLIKINYERRMITLYDRETYKYRESDFTPVPLEVFRNKLYLNTQLEVVPDSTAKVKLLIDTGAGLSMLLFTDTHPLVHPPARVLPSNIGMGLGGYIEGFTGRVHSVALGEFTQQGVVTYFQSLDTTLNLEYLNHRNGLVGNVILSHFLVVLDYQEGTMWLKPNRMYREAFIYDRSGLSIVASGSKFNEFVVQNVLPNSPAEEAGILRDDRIVSIRRTPSGFYSLSDIQFILKKKPGKKIRIVVKRDGKRLKKTIVLRELI